MDQDEIPRDDGQRDVDAEQDDNGEENAGGDRFVAPPEDVQNIEQNLQRRRPCRLCVEYAREIGLANYAELICFNCQGPRAVEGVYVLCPRYIIDLIRNGTIHLGGNMNGVDRRAAPAAPAPAPGNVEQYYLKLFLTLFSQLMGLIIVCFWCILCYYYPVN